MRRVFDPKDEYEDTKGVTRIRKTKKDRQHIGQKNKNKRTNNDASLTPPLFIEMPVPSYEFVLMVSIWPLSTI